jgi:hypothetical protein
VPDGRLSARLGALRILGVEVLATGPDGYQQLDIEPAGTLAIKR